MAHFRAATLAAIAAGCSGPPHPPFAEVTGVVTFRGDPVTAGRIRFEPDGPAASEGAAVGFLGVGGRFRVSGAAVGRNRVCVETAMFANFRADNTGVLPGDAPVKPPAYKPTPAKYESFDTSGLTCEIRPGTNKLDIVLTE